MTQIGAKKEFLLNHPFFQGCGTIELARLLPHVSARTLATGEILYRDGEPASAMYLVDEGSLTLTARGIKTDIDSLAGEEALLGIKTYAGEMQAQEDSRLWQLPRASLANLANCPGISQRAACSLASRFAERAGTETVPASPAPEVSWLTPFGWLMATLAPLAVLFFLRSDTQLTAMPARYFLAILTSVAVMWMFRLLPDFIPVLFALLALIIFGVAPPATILSGFGSEGFFMALSVLGLGTVIRASGLGFRLLLLLIGIRPQSRWWHNFTVFLVGLILTPIIPSVNGRISIVSSFVTELLGNDQEERNRLEAGRLTIAALSGAGLFSAIFLSSKSINFLMFGFLPEQEQLRFQWSYWLLAAAVTGLAMFAMFIPAWSVIFRTTTPPTICRNTIRAQLRILGHLAPAEIAALGGIVIFAASLATSTIHRIEVPWIALSILFGLLMFGFLARDDFRRNIDWSFLFFLGGLIGMVRVMREVGVDKWLAGHCGWLTGYMTHDIHIFILLLTLIIFLVRLFLPINACAVIFMTLLMPAAVVSGVNPWLIGFMILFLSESYLFPYQASYYLQYCSQTGYGYPSQDNRLVPFNLAIIVMKVAALYLSLPWWRHLGLL